MDVHAFCPGRLGEERVDALIVGAGPAGLAAGTVLARNGLRVLLCDRRRLPIDKACGEGLLPTGLGHLEELGARRFLDPAEVRPFVGIRFWTPSGQSAAAEFAEGPGWGIRRLELSRAMERAARSWAGLEIVEGTPVHELSATPQGTRVRLGERLVMARLVIGADGLNSRVRRWAGLEGRPAWLARMGARQHFQIAPWSDYVEVLGGPGIEAYVTPCGKERVGVSFLWDRRRYRDVPGGPGMMRSLLQAFPELERRLQGAPPASSPRSSGPLCRAATKRCSDGVILIGDAGGYLDACTGEGLSLAFAQALALERTVAPLLARGEGKPRRGELRAYARACRRITRSYYLGTRLQLFVNRRPVLAERWVAALARHPDVMQHLLSANMNRAAYWPGWSGAVRILFAMCSRRGAEFHR